MKNLGAKPFIRTMSLRNFLSFGDSADEIEMKSLNVFIGPNGSGKSNLIEALSILKESPTDLSELIRQGGGNNNKSLKSKCREGFNKFFRKSSLTGRLPRIIACGSRKEAYDDFRTALKNAGGNDFPILLADSEDAIANPFQP